MAFELRHLRYFVAVAEERNFTRAAKRVGIGQPPLSEQIRDLEALVGTPLFVRSRRGAELTSAGSALLPEARAVLARAEHALGIARRSARGEIGRIRVGFTSSAAFHKTTAATLRAFVRAHPDVDLVLDEASTTPLLERLAEGQLDAAFVRPGRHDPPDVDVHECDHEPMVAALPSRHPLAKRKTIALRELAADTLVLFPRTLGAGLYDEIIGACHAAGFEPRLGQVAPQLTSVANFVAAELGVAFVPRSIAQVRVAGVSYVSLGKTAPIARLALVTRPDDDAVLVRHLVELVGR